MKTKIKPYFIITDTSTLELAVIYSDTQLDNSVEVSESNSGFIKPKANNIEFTEVVEGATKEEMDELNKVEVPQTISKMDLRIQLVLIDKPIDNIIQMIKSLPKEYLNEKQKQIILIKLEFASYFERSSPELNQLAPIIGITQDDLDNIFINGNKK